MLWYKIVHQWQVSNEKSHLTLVEICNTFRYKYVIHINMWYIFLRQAKGFQISLQQFLVVVMSSISLRSYLTIRPTISEYPSLFKTNHKKYPLHNIPLFRKAHIHRHLYLILIKWSLVFYRTNLHLVLFWFPPLHVHLVSLRLSVPTY